MMQINSHYEPVVNHYEPVEKAALMENQIYTISSHLCSNRLPKLHSWNNSVDQWSIFLHNCHAILQ